MKMDRPALKDRNAGTTIQSGAMRVAATEPIDNRQSTIDNSSIWRALQTVMDPEIPVLSIVDMGMVAGVEVSGHAVRIKFTPTFVGCPAIDWIRSDIRRTILECGATEVDVQIVFDPPWSSDRITPEGRRKLKEFGLAPPGESCAGGQEMMHVPCPYCNSSHTELESIFGPTLCRAIHYCHDCLQSFEHFKPV